MALSKINTNSIADDAITTAKVNPAQTDVTSVGTLTGLTVDGDVGFTGTNYNVSWDKSDDALEFQDNAKLKIGTGDDLQIYHDGSNSYIDDSGTGSLFLRSNNIIMHKYTGENLITATADAEVNLYYNDSLKLTTISSGVEIKNGATGQQPLLLLKDMNSGVVSGDEGGGLYWYTNDSNGTGNNLAIIQKFENSSGGAGMAFETGTGSSRSERMRIDASGKVGIGTDDPDGHSSPNGARLCVHTSSGASMIQINATGTNQSSGLEFTDNATQGQIHYYHGNNSLTFTVAGTQHFVIASNGDLTATDTSISSISDERLKTNIKDYSYDLEVFKKFKPKTFDWKNPKEHGDKSGVRGFSAQDILNVDTYLVSQTDIEPNTAIPNLDAEADLIPKDSDGKRLSYTSKLDGNDAMYISVIQQLIAKIETLEAKVKALEEA